VDGYTLQRILFAYRAAVIAADLGTSAPSEPENSFFEQVAALERAQYVSRAIGNSFAILEAISPYKSFGARMILGGLLAAYQLKPSDYDVMALRRSQRDHSAPRTVAARAASRVADFNLSRVDGGLLLDIAALLDRLSSLDCTKTLKCRHQHNRVSTKLLSTASCHACPPIDLAAITGGALAFLLMVLT